jgi:coupling of ubiquitin conjugation to ER degradation protein 1
MGEVVNVLVAFAVIVFIFRWATSSKFISLHSNIRVLNFRFLGNDTAERSAADTLGFRPKPVTQDMVLVQLLRQRNTLTRLATDKHHIEHVP